MPAPPTPPSGDRPLKTLERVLSKAGLASRTEARRLVAAGRVQVDGRVERDPDFWVDLERDRVALDGVAVQRGDAVYLVLHKPVGYLTTRHDRDGRPTIYDLLGEEESRLVTVGRLDLDTSGLLLLTSDTAFVEQIANPDFHVPKTYQVEASAHLTDEQLDRLRRGVELKDGPTRPAEVRRLGEHGVGTVFEITITEGRNRQVRRMVEALGAEVVRLARTAIGSLTIGDLALGATRPLTPAELRALCQT